MSPNLLPYKNSGIAWYRFGNGVKPVVCFHGYGEDAMGFEFLSRQAGSSFSFYAIDLPFHGKTEWNEGLSFTETELSEIIRAILGNSTIEYSLIGFSLGGRVALSLYQVSPEKIDKIVLLAPDGLKLNFWYWLATRTSMGNRFFAFTMKHPGWFFGFLKFLDKLKLVNPSIFKFVNQYIGDEEVREALYTRWTGLRKLRPGLKKIKLLVKQNSTLVRLVYGKHDRIIVSSVGQKFRKGIEEYCNVRVIEAGHQVLHERRADEILDALKH